MLGSLTLEQRAVVRRSGGLQGCRVLVLNQPVLLRRLFQSVTRVSYLVHITLVHVDQAIDLRLEDDDCIERHRIVSACRDIPKVAPDSTAGLHLPKVVVHLLVDDDDVIGVDLQHEDVADGSPRRVRRRRHAAQTRQEEP